MEEVIEMCTKGYGGCDIRLVAQILLKKPTPRKKMLLLSQTLLGLGIKKSMGRRKKPWVRGNPCHQSPLCFPFRFYEEASPSLCAKYVPLEREKRKQTGDFIQDIIFHQAVLLLQAVEGNAGNSLSQSISYFCFPSSCPSSAGSGTRCPWAGEVWGTLPALTPISPSRWQRGFQLSQEGREGWSHQQAQAWGQCLGPPGATHSWNVQPVRSLEARQGGQQFLFVV